MIVINKDNYIFQLKEKDSEALKYVINEYSNLIFKVAYSLLNNRELSKECLNDVYMKIWNNSNRFNGEEAKFKNWICTITKYTAIDKLRKEEKHSKNVNLDSIDSKVGNLVEDIYEGNESVEIIQREVNNMEEIDREIFVRRFYNGEKIKDIANCLGISDNAVNLRILRGRKRLSESLKGVS